MRLTSHQPGKEFAMQAFLDAAHQFGVSFTGLTHLDVISMLVGALVLPLIRAIHRVRS